LFFFFAQGGGAAPPPDFSSAQFKAQGSLIHGTISDAPLVLAIKGGASLYYPTGQETRSGASYTDSDRQILGAMSLNIVGRPSEHRPFNYGVIADVAFRPEGSNVTIHTEVPIIDRLPEKSVAKGRVIDLSPGARQLVTRTNPYDPDDPGVYTVTVTLPAPPRPPLTEP
jgi:hypothetical protein